MKKFIYFIFLIIISHPVIADGPPSKNIFSEHIESEEWIKSHLLKGMNRADVLKLAGNPSFENTGSTGAWVMSYLLKEPPDNVKENNAYAGFQVSLKDGKVIQIDIIHRTIKLHHE